MFKWLVPVVGCLTAACVGYFIILQADNKISSINSLNRLHLPLERTDYLQQTVHAPVVSGDISISARESGAFRDLNRDVPQPSAALGSTSAAMWSGSVQENEKPLRIRGSKAADSLAEIELIRQVQQELRRAGCGMIDVSGAWDNATKSALYKFVTNSNASLPIVSPDIVLLSLVRNYKGERCGLNCIGPSCPTIQQAGILSSSPQLIAPPKLAQKNGARTVASSWNTEIVPGQSNARTASASDRAASQTNTGQLPPETQRTPVRPSNYQTVDTTSFGGRRMSLGARANEVEDQEIYRPSGAITSLPNVTAAAPQQKRKDRTVSVSSTNAGVRTTSVKIRRKISRKRSYRRSRKNWRTDAFTPRN